MTLKSTIYWYMGISSDLNGCHMSIRFCLRASSNFRYKMNTKLEKNVFLLSDLVGVNKMTLFFLTRLTANVINEMPWSTHVLPCQWCKFLVSNKLFSDNCSKTTNKPTQIVSVCLSVALFPCCIYTNLLVVKFPCHFLPT